MGNENSIVCQPDQVSEIDGASPTILTEPIELDRDTFMDDLMETIKYPIIPVIERAVKEVKVTEITEFGDAPQQFEVRVLLDGKKLDEYSYLGVGKGDGTDMIMNWTKSSYDPDTGRLFTRTYKVGYVGEADVNPEVEVETFLTARKDPFRFEYYWHDYREGKKGERIAGEDQVKLLKLYCTGPIQNQCDRKAKLVLNADATEATSEPLDELLSKEALLEGWFECARAQCKREQREIEETMPNEQFFATLKIELPGAEAKPSVNKVKVDLDMDDGTVTTELMMNDDIIGTETFKATGPMPLILTCTKEDKDGNKAIAKGWLAQCQAQLDAVIRKETSGWFF